MTEQRPKQHTRATPRPPRGRAGHKDTAKVRLQRFLADAGVASRRASELLIAEGRVAVNGNTVTEIPAFVQPGKDRVQVDGTVIQSEVRRIYVMLNKPGKTLSTVEDEPGAARRTVMHLVDHPSGTRLYPVGRLDYDTRGLVLLTNDGDFANKLTHPRYGVEKTYHATVKGSLNEAAIARLEHGIYLAQRREGRTVGAVRAAHVKLKIIRQSRGQSVLEVVLKEGRNRQVRRMLAAVGCPVKKLERVAFGSVMLKGLARGQWRELTRIELQKLRRSVDTGKNGAHNERRSGGRAGENRGADGERDRASRGRSGRSGGSGSRGDRTGSGGREGREGRGGTSSGKGLAQRDRSHHRGPSGHHS